MKKGQPATDGRLTALAATEGQPCPEMADIGGAAPLPWDDDRKMFRAAGEALRTLAAREEGKRHARLMVLSGWLIGVSVRR